MDETMLVWTDYMRYRVRLRGFNLATVEYIVRYSTERYMDTATGRLVAVGRHDQCLVMVPYEREGNVLTPVTIHVTTRQQVNSRAKSGRFRRFPLTVAMGYTMSASYPCGSPLRATGKTVQVRRGPAAVTGDKGRLKSLSG